MLRLINFLFVITFLIIIHTGCDTVESTKTNNTSGDWLLKENEIFDGGPGKDGIPALESPNFTDVTSIRYLTDNDLVLIAKINGEIKIYPHPILDWHEIINDGIGGTKYAITYCPLTGSGISWNRTIDGVETTFGVSTILI